MQLESRYQFANKQKTNAKRPPWYLINSMSNSGYGDDDDGFAMYQATATDPGWPLMIVTFGYCLFVYFVAWIWIMKKRRVDRANASTVSSASTTSASSSSQQRLRDANPTRKDIKDVESLSAAIAFGNNDHETPSKQERKLRTKKPTEIVVAPTIEMKSNRKSGEQNKKAFRIGRRRKASAIDDDESVLTFGSFLGRGRDKGRQSNKGMNQSKEQRDPVADYHSELENEEDEIAKRKAAYGRSDSDYHPMEEIDDVEEMLFLDEPMAEIHKLSGPW